MRALVTALLCVAGCGNLTEGHGVTGSGGRVIGSGGTSAPPPPTTVEFVPSDGRTAIDATWLGVKTTGLPQAQLDSIQGGLSLSALPGEIAVAATTTQEASAQVRLQPDGTLKDGWYMMGLAPPADWTPTFPLGNAIQLGTGGFAVRFRVGSAPIVLAVEVCEPTKLRILFSEPVGTTAADVMAAISVSQGAAGALSCTGVLPTASAPQDFFQVTCAFDWGAPMTVAITGAFASASGAPIADPTGTTGTLEYTFTPADQPISGTKCWAFGVFSRVSTSSLK